VKAEVVSRHVNGESKRAIARQVGIDRETVDHILEEADMATTLVELGYTNKAIVENHLKPLLEATKTGVYGTEIAGATRLGAVRLIDKWKGISAKVKAKIEADVENARNKSQPKEHTVCLVVPDEARAARLARLLAPGGAADVVIDVDAKVDAKGT
jgi:hypothetical protein